MDIITACIITFIASFCILVIEIVSGRILTLFVGVSLYVKVNSVSDRAGKLENLSCTVF